MAGCRFFSLCSFRVGKGEIADFLQYWSTSYSVTSFDCICMDFT